MKVPEGFLETMGTPDAVQVQIIYRDADTFEEHIVNDLLYAMSNLLGTAQCSVLTAGEYAKEMGFDDSQAYAVEGAVTNNSFSYVMGKRASYCILYVVHNHDVGLRHLILLQGKQ